MGFMWYNPVRNVLIGLRSRVEDLILLANKRRCYASTGIVTGSVIISSLIHRFSLRQCDCTTDLTGKTVVITGGNEGIGKATAMEMARRNATVIIGCKDVTLASQTVKEIKAATGNQKISYKPLDLSSFESVENFADSINRTETNVNSLVNSADFFYSGERKMTVDGCEEMMQSNYLGHFLLTTSLAGTMEDNAPSRIINLSSIGHQWASLDLKDISSSNTYSSMAAYLKSKLACTLFTTELSRRLENKGVTVNTVNPGFVRTSSKQGFIMRILYFFYGKTPSEGAQTVLYAALSPELEKVSGKYFRNCKERKLARVAKNKYLAANLFKISEDIVGLKV